MRTGGVVAGALPAFLAASALAGCATPASMTGSMTGVTGSVSSSATGSATSMAGPASPTARTDGVVPWNPLPPSRLRLPVVTRPPSPDPALAAGLPACRVGDLRVTSQNDGAAMGTRVLVVRLAARGTTRCRVEGWPQVVVRATGPGAPVPVERRPSPTAPEPPGAVAVSATQAATLTLFWPGGWCAAAVRVTGVDVVLPGGRLRVKGFGAGSCADPDLPRQKVAIGVGPFAAEDAVPGLTGSPLGDVTGEVRVDGPAVAGARLTGVLTLTAPTDVPLEPCPDLQLGVYTSQAQWEADHGVDCAAIAAADPDHLARLRAGVPLRLALQWQVPSVATGDAKVVVRVDDADGPAFGRAVPVTR